MLTVYDELIAALRFCDGGECDGCCEYKKEHGCNTLLRDAADAIEALSMKLHGDEAAIAGMKREIERMVVTGADKPKWIPVTERLPPYGDRILVTDKTGVWEGYLSYSRGFMRNTGMKIKDIYDVEVTHWMPLPEPPKKEPDA